MMKMYSMGGMGGMDLSMYQDRTLILNVNHPLVKYIIDNKESEYTDTFCKQLYDLVMIANAPLKPETMTEFIKISD